MSVLIIQHAKKMRKSIHVEANMQRKLRFQTYDLPEFHFCQRMIDIPHDDIHSAAIPAGATAAGIKANAPPPAASKNLYLQIYMTKSIVGKLPKD